MTGRAVEEDPVEAYAAALRGTDREVTLLFVGSRFINEAEGFIAFTGKFAPFQLRYEPPRSYSY